LGKGKQPEATVGHREENAPEKDPLGHLGGVQKEKKPQNMNHGKGSPPGSWKTLPSKKRGSPTKRRKKRLAGSLQTEKGKKSGFSGGTISSRLEPEKRRGQLNTGGGENWYDPKKRENAHDEAWKGGKKGLPLTHPEKKGGGKAGSRGD